MAVDLLLTLFESRGQQRLVSAFNMNARAAAGFEAANVRALRSSSAWSAAGAVGLAGLLTIGKQSLQAAGEVERVNIGFKTILGSQEKANKLMADVRQLDLETPFDFLTTAKLAQQGLASGFRDDLIPTMRSVAAATVAAGKGTDVYARAMAIVSKIKAQGVLTQIRLNQFGSAGIPVKDILKKELGLSDDDLVNIGKLKLRADVVLPALQRGFEKEFKGALKNASKTYLGSLEILSGSKDKLLAGIGKSIQGDATKGIQFLNKLTSSASDFVAIHPRLTRAGLALAGIGAGFAIWKGYSKAMGVARLAHLALEKSVARDIAVERIKTGVAYQEAAAHNAAAAAAGRHAVANGALAISGGAASAGMGARALAAGSALPALMPAGGGAVAAGTARAAGGSALARWLLTPVRAGLVNSFGDPLTRLSALSSLAIGAGAGIGSYNDRRATGGIGEGQNKLYSGITGAVVAGAAAFIPPARLVALAAEGLRLSINRSYNEPLEKRAEQGSGLSDKQIKENGANFKAQADSLNALARKKEAEADAISTTLDFAGDDRARQAELRKEAQVLRLSASLRNQAALRRDTPGTEENLAQLRARGAEFLKKNPVETGNGLLVSNRVGTPNPEDYRGTETQQQNFAARDQRAREAYEAGSPQFKATVANQSRNRVGVQTMTIKATFAPGAGEDLARATSYRAKAPRRRMM